MAGDFHLLFDSKLYAQYGNPTLNSAQPNSSTLKKFMNYLIYGE